MARLITGRQTIVGEKEQVTDQWADCLGSRTLVVIDSSTASVSSHGHSSSSHGSGSMLYETIKSVGIAGGRPLSSYYFVGVQGDGLPSSSVRRRASAFNTTVVSSSSPGHHSHTSTHSHERRWLSPEAAYARGGSTSPESGHGHSFARCGSLNPELVYARGGSMSPDFGYTAHGQPPMTEDEFIVVRPSASRSASRDDKPAYSAAEMRTFHCERVRKMPLSGLDPSVLIGFVVRDEAEWVDLRRVKELPRAIFAIADEPPTWPGADDEMGLESISDPDASHALSSNASHGFSTLSRIAASTFSHTHHHHNSNPPPTPLRRAAAARAARKSTPRRIPSRPSRPSLARAPHSKDKGKGTVGDVYAELEGDDGFIDAGGEMGLRPGLRVLDVGCAFGGPARDIARFANVEIIGLNINGFQVRRAQRYTKQEQEQEGGVRAQRALPPFLGSVEDGSGVGTPSSPRERERERMVAVSLRARDGGRTQSGGVRGILTEDS
ncbi:hypothetical protein B0H16DRAFT_1889681 [Mycena metata]|uniref:Cysteine protease n=1 Tax=Mycena metata TaxID=1033252 RepID=A0AAD7IJ78_9AGAR|nr:hypothetical protein B0H16DRAFT_1889681 [Mycena metata]